MSKRTLKMICLVIALVTLLVLSACGGSNAEPPEDQNSGQTVADSTTDDASSGSKEDAGYPKTMYVTAEDGLKLRKEPGTDKEEIGGMAYGQEIKVEKIENGWAYTTVDGKSGWCSAEYLTENKDEIKQQDSQTPAVTDPDKNRLVEPANKAENGTHGYVDAPEGVNVRYGPGLEYGIVDGIANGTSVIERGWDNNWVYVEYDNGRTGWISADFFRTSDGAEVRY